MRDDVIVDVLQSAAQVADAHGGGDAAPADLAKTLDLHAASERGEAVGEHVVLRGQQADTEQDESLDQDGELAPMQDADKPFMHQVAHHDADGKAQDRQEEMHGEGDVALGDVHAREQDVARLRVGEHAAATDVGIHVHKATDQRQDDAELDRLGYLLRALHAPFPLTSAQRRSCTAYAMPNLNLETVSPN